MTRPTTRISLKTIAWKFPVGSIERSYLHGTWQLERGRKPSLVHGNHKNAQTAYRMSQYCLHEYFVLIRYQLYSRQKFFWSNEMIRGVQERALVSDLPLPAPYKEPP